MALLYKVTLSIPSSFLSLVTDYFFFFSFFVCVHESKGNLRSKKSLTIYIIDILPSYYSFIFLSLSFAFYGFII